MCLFCYHRGMNVFRKHVEYVKDNPERYWFKRKLYGWGWTPVTWQGWAITLLFVGFVIWNGIGLAARAEAGVEPTRQEMIDFFLKLGVAVLALVVVAWKTGESPRWTWGFPKTEEKRN